jgi:signal recognition particle subunit SRP19
MCNSAAASFLFNSSFSTLFPNRYRNADMSRNARIEEVSDSDLDSDPSDMDPSDFDPTSIIRPANIPPPSRNASTATPPVQPQFRAPPPSQANIDVYRKWQCLYPVYFDKSRSRAEGRRVGKELTVNSPLANEIAKAVVSLGLKAVLDVMKRHPKDWANPGRVKVMLKDSGGGIAGVKNSKLSIRLRLQTLN